MNRYSTIRIEIADTALARMRVNGLFRADNTETFVRLLEASFDATAEQAGDVIVLKRVTAPGR
jgi:ferric-dicitrate binding protein FerR (iron transport regulator)